jgi:hypothetical protein
MTALQLAWDPSRSYRCFVDKPAGTANLVGSCIVDDATGHQIGPVVIVADTAGTVCDLEVRLTQVAGAPSAMSAPHPEDVERADVVVATAVTPHSDPAVLLDDDWLIIAFTDMRRARWCRLADSPVYLRIGDGELAAVAVRAPESDVGGVKESTWLDSLEGTGGAGNLRRSPVET